MNAFKNILIILLSLLTVIFWLSPEDDEYEEDSVIIEYNCSQLDDYESVPYEVRDECKKRQKVKNNLGKYNVSKLDS